MKTIVKILSFVLYEVCFLLLRLVVPADWQMFAGASLTMFFLPAFLRLLEDEIE